MSDTLLHRWTQPDPVGDPTRWACSCLIEHRGTPPDLLCPDRVAQMQADLLDARRELEAERARVAELEGLTDVLAGTLEAHTDRRRQDLQALAAEREAHAALRAREAEAAEALRRWGAWCWSPEGLGEPLYDAAVDGMPAWAFPDPEPPAGGES